MISSILPDQQDASTPTHDARNESTTAKAKLRGIIRKGILQRKTTRSFSRKRIQFVESVNVYTQKESAASADYDMPGKVIMFSIYEFIDDTF